MSTVRKKIEQAFARLAEMPGYVDRPQQLHLALLLSDLIESKQTGLFEAPTGLGKSLATLIPAIAHAQENGTRTVIATYTNVLAEQYWRKDLPLAMGLFDDHPSSAMLIGRQRYACLHAAGEIDGKLKRDLKDHMVLGVESEFRRATMKTGREAVALWQKIASPPVCPGRFCPDYSNCYYYNARKEAEKAGVVITNHSVVIQDAILANAAENESSLLGEYEFLILDEAHDFPEAAINGLEFEISPLRLNMLAAMGSRVERSLESSADRMFDTMLWQGLCNEFRKKIELAQHELAEVSMGIPEGGILRVSPQALADHPAVKRAQRNDFHDPAAEVALQVASACNEFTKAVKECVDSWKEQGDGELLRIQYEFARSYLAYIGEYGINATRMFDPEGVAVTYAGSRDPLIRQDLVSLQEPLQELLWNRLPVACLSATLALDGNFDFFRRATGIEASYEEVLPSPFDYSSQAALYLPPRNVIPDPTQARAQGAEDAYYRAIADELTHIITLMQGRTLALFHSRKEMEGVRERMHLSDEFPILMQLRSGASSVGDRFKQTPHASLFALRSFWTGFDAPGETCSCVVLVRVPFEVPVDPPQIARMAWLQSQGLDPFQAYSLPQAKKLMRQGAGRLIRTAEDKGLICLLDPRLVTKTYGDEILSNLPQDMRRFSDVGDAIGWLGLA